MLKSKDLILNEIRNNNLSIDSLYIEENNQLEKIIDSNNLHELRSCSKLLIALAVGIAIDKGLLNLEENIASYFDKYIINNKNRNKIAKWTLRTLLTHTTGYDKMLMSQKQIVENNLDTNNLLEYILNIDIENEPNSTVVYNNVEPFLISVLFREKLNIDILEFVKINIFNKLEIIDYKWEKYGEYCPGCTGLYLTPNDFHKIAKLVLNNGKYNDNQIVSSSWIEKMCKKQVDTPYMVKKERLFPKNGIGYYTFISNDGFVFRDGTNGQYVIMNKNKNLLITIMSSEKEMNKITEIFRNIIM